jgi:hypothetical protein
MALVKTNRKVLCLVTLILVAASCLSCNARNIRTFDSSLLHDIFLNVDFLFELRFHDQIDKLTIYCIHVLHFVKADAMETCELVHGGGCGEHPEKCTRDICHDDRGYCKYNAICCCPNKASPSSK